MAKPSPIVPLNILEFSESDGELLRPSGSDQVDDAGSPLNLLLELIDAGEHSDAAHPAAVSFLKDGLTQYLTGEQKSLSESLGLPRKDRQTHRRAMQQIYLREAWRHLEKSWPRRTARANALADESLRLEAKWQEFSVLKDPDPNWARVRMALWRARKFGPLPKQRQLLRIL